MNRDEIFGFAEAVLKNRWPDYQVAALLMAFRLAGLSPSEVLWLTQAMARYSGRLAGFGSRFTADKHSSGGVGDGISLVLAPLAASLGLNVPMMSGRSLGLTGGTLDKLEAIPGFNVQLTPAAITRQVKRLGLAMFGQTKELAGVDRKLYALRDAIGAVDHAGLVTASIVSKKLIEGLDAIVFDVKFGRGAIFSSVQEARNLAGSLAGVSKKCGLRARALVTLMDEPLGRAVGNALEIQQAWEFLNPDSLMQKNDWEDVWDFRDLTLGLLHEMLLLAGVSRDRRETESYAKRSLGSGAALRKFQEMLEAQGVSPTVPRTLPGHLSRPSKKFFIRAPRNGFVSFIDARGIAMACLHLGALRRRQEDGIDHSAGIWLAKKTGDKVKKGDILAEIHATRASRQDCKIALDYALGAYRFSGRPPRRSGVIREIIR